MGAPTALMIGYNGANNTGAEALVQRDIADLRAVLGPGATPHRAHPAARVRGQARLGRRGGGRRGTCRRRSRRCLTPRWSSEGLHKAYGPVVAASDLSIEMRTGEIFGLLGPNGSGKTTTVECAQGLRKPDRGRIRVLGLDPLTRRGELRRRVGTQLQESSLPDRIKVWEVRSIASLLGRAIRRLHQEQPLDDLAGDR